MIARIFISLGRILCLFVFCTIPFLDVTAQTDTSIWVIKTNDGVEFVGTITSQDSREVTVMTRDKGEIIIPKYQIKEMKVAGAEYFSPQGEYAREQIFYSRYFLTTNGLPIEKGDNYIIFNLLGVDLQFGVGENLGVGLLTSWVGMPMVASIKYSFEVDKKLHLGLGALVGTASWVNPDGFIGALPFGAITIGERRKNINFSTGWVGFFREGESNGTGLVSISGMTTIGKKVSLVFDSVIIPGLLNNFDMSSAFLSPGFRIETRNDRAFQLGFLGISIDGEMFPVPIPLAQIFVQL